MSNSPRGIPAFLVGSSTATSFLIDTNGNVSIGATTSPTNKLEIAGTINAWSFQRTGIAHNGVPTGAISYFTGVCPTGWTEYTSARGRVVVGTPASGTAEGTVGTALTNLQDPTHTHTVSDTVAHSHTVTVTDPGHTHTTPGTTSTTGDSTRFMRKADDGQSLTTTSSSNTTGITATSSNVGASSVTTSATSATMPYIQLRACQAPTGADYAEEYATHDATLSPGELVSLDPKNPRMVKRLEHTDTEALIGVVSTKPGYLIGDIFSQDGRDGIYERPIALKGQAPVKITLENGPIIIGDRIAPSKTKPGYGAKAIGPSPTIGYAMEYFDGAVRKEKGISIDTNQEGIVVTFIDLGWYALDYNISSIPDTSSSTPLQNTFWKSFSVDPNNFFFKPSFGVDLEGKDIINVASINANLSSPLWRILSDGTLEAKHLVAKDTFTIGTPEKPSGIEFFDLKTKQIRCSVFLNGALQSFIGECSQENLARVVQGTFLTLDTHGKSTEESSAHLDSSISGGQVQGGGWTIDQTTGKLTAAFTAGLDLNGNSLENVSRILSANGKWKIDEDGTLMTVRVITDEVIAKNVKTEKLCIGSTCVTEAQLKELLDKNQISGSFASTLPSALPPSAPGSELPSLTETATSSTVIFSATTSIPAVTP